MGVYVNITETQHADFHLILMKFTPRRYNPEV